MAEPLKSRVQPTAPTEETGTGSGGWELVSQEPMGAPAPATGGWELVSQEPFVPGGGDFRPPEGPRPSPPISMGEPLGPPEPQQNMRGIVDRAVTGAKGTWGDTYTPMDMFRHGGIPGAVLEPTMRGIPAATSAIAGGVAGVAEHLGMSQANADRLQRDLDVLGNKVLPAVAPSGVSTRAPKAQEWQVVKQEPAPANIKVPTAEEYLKPIKLDLTHLTEYTDPATGERYISFAAKDETGQPRAKMDVMVTGDTLHLNDIRAIGPDGAELPPEAAKNIIGPKQMRGLLKQFREDFPEVKNILADRISGARTGGEYDVMKGKEINVSLPEWQLVSQEPMPRSGGAAATPPTFTQQQLQNLIQMAEQQAATMEKNAADPHHPAATRAHYAAQAQSLRAAIPQYQAQLNNLGHGGAGQPPLPPPGTPPTAGAPPPNLGPGITPTTTAEEAVLSRIGREPKAARYGTSDAYRDFVDNLHPFKKVMEGTAPVDTALNPYEQFRLTRGVGGKAEHMLKHGTFDFNTLEDVGPSFADIVKPVEGELQSFKAYLLAKSAVERHAQGIDTGVNHAAAQQVVRDGAMRFENTRKRLKTYQDQIVDYLVDAGMVDKNMADTFRTANQDYVPWYRVQDEAKSAPSAGGGFRTKKPIHKMEGSERQVYDPLESIIRNTQMFVTLAERNRANSTFVDWATTHKPGLVKRVQEARPIEVHGGEVEKFLSQMGVPPEMVGNLNNDSFSIFRNLHHKLDSDEIAIWRNGKRQVYRTEPELAKIIHGMDQPEIGLMTRLLAKPAQWLRAGVVLTPDYMARNFFRDQMNAAIQSKNGYVPVYDFMKGLGSYWRGGQDYRNWLKSGGAQSALVSLDRDYKGADFVWKYGDPRDHTLRAQTSNVVKKPLDALRALSESVDAATRIGEFARSTQGRTDAPSMMRGAMASRDVTQDFQRIGARQRGWNMVTAFHNAQIQGTDREFTNLLSKNAKRALPIIAGAVTVPSILLWYANHGDPRYETAPWWEKDLFWFYLPDDPKAPPFKFPKPFLVGMLFGSLPERILSSYFDGKPDAFNKFGKSIWGTMMPNMIPTALLPMIEQTFNKSIFLDRPLVPKSMTEGGGRVPPAQQYTNQTPEVMKLAGGAVSKIPGMEMSSMASPIVLQNYVRAYGGTMGNYGMQAADKALALVGGPTKPPGPTKSWAALPFIRAFTKEYPSANAQPISDFYENWDELQRRKNTMQTLSKVTGDNKKDIMYEQDAVKRLQAMERGMGAVRKEIKAIESDPVMHPDMKRDKIRDLWLEMVHMAKEGNRVMREMGEFGSSKPLETPSLQPGARHKTMGTWKALPPGSIIAKPKYGGPI